ncbi:MAG: hypothetical protein NTV43_17690 [Methylococcales bacterium]|nr:hypothetical protein [Methylococcales bacterium]
MSKYPLLQIDMHEVRNHYLARHKVSKKIRVLVESKRVDAFVQLALGISDVQGNYSASDHALGPRILSSSSAQSVFSLSARIAECADSRTMLNEVYSANIPYLKVSVGSEIAMLLNPSLFWVANTRTVWAHLLIKHGFNYDIANEELSLYRDQDSSSEMEYKKWREIYTLMKPNLIKLGELGDEEAKRNDVEPGKIRSIWFDALSNALYEKNKS